jgi:hypothetical protein
MAVDKIIPSQGAWDPHDRNAPPRPTSASRRKPIRTLRVDWMGMHLGDTAFVWNSQSATDLVIWLWFNGINSDLMGSIVINSDLIVISWWFNGRLMMIQWILNRYPCVN